MAVAITEYFTPASPPIPVLQMGTTDLVATIERAVGIPATRSIHATDAQRAVGRWAAENLPPGHVFANPAAARTFGSAVSWAYPDARPDRLQLLAQWGVWFFWVDDLLSRGHEATVSVVGIRLRCKGTDDHEGKAIVGLYDDLYARTMALATPAWRKRFQAQLSICLAAFETERLHRVSGAPAGLGEFIELRRDASGVSFQQSFIDFALDIDLPVEFYNSPQLQRVLRCAADIEGWTNDIFSYRKELSAGELDNILIVLRSGHPELSESAALGTVLSAITRRSSDLRAAEQALLESPAVRGTPNGSFDDIQAFVNAVRSMVAGNLAWIAESPRYREESGAATT